VADAEALVIEDGEAVGVTVTGARQPGEQFARTRLADVTLNRCDFSACDFSEAVWHRVTLIGCRGSSVELAGARLRHVTFSDCRIDEANLRLAQLRDVTFAECGLAASLWNHASLEGVRFPDCDLRNADFSNVRVEDTDLRRARLDGLQGAGSLRGATIGVDQLVTLAPAIAAALGLHVRPEDESDR
jgi:uncharacterized protein YjbI with pentapeptide repeats